MAKKSSQNSEITRLSTKGQVVIPKKARTDLNLAESDKFLVFWKDNTIILKKIELPKNPLK